MSKELDAFNEFGVYEEVEDREQDALSSRWIMTDKFTEKEKKVKARLVARGFKEKVKKKADSPTGSRETLHMLLEDQEWGREKCLPKLYPTGQRRSWRVSS